MCSLRYNQFSFVKQDFQEVHTTIKKTKNSIDIQFTRNPRMQ